MPSVPRLLLIASFSLISLPIWNQQSDTLNDSGLLARLAYETTAVARRGALRQVCVAVTRDGEYRIMRATTDQPTEFLRGELTKEQFARLKTLLDSPKFRAQASHAGALIRQDAEDLRVEVTGSIRENGDGSQRLEESDAWRLQWLNADGDDPFPQSVAKVANWLQNFQPKNAKEFFYTEFPDVCPSEGFRLVQPGLAFNED